MAGNLRTDEDIIAWLEQEYAQPFEGWDFSYLRGRRTPLGSLPWDYGSIVLRYLSKSSSVLDIDTGGGEALAGILAKSDFKGQISTIESYAPNVPIARKRLERLGVEVHDTAKKAARFDEGAFDLVIDSHGGSLNPREILRMLKTSGHFVTEQVGDRTNSELRELFGSPQVLQPDWPHNAHDAAREFPEIGFTIEELDEHSYPVRFSDVGALVYFLKAVPWEVPGFSIERNSEALIELHRSSLERGFAVDATYHAYMLAACKP